MNEANPVLEAAREVLQAKRHLGDTDIPLILDIAISKLETALKGDPRKTTVHLSCMQWVECSVRTGMLMMGGSDETTVLFRDIKVSNEEELIERCDAAIKAHFHTGWVDVRLFHKRGPRLDLDYVIREIGDNGTVRVGDWTKELDDMLDMRTPCGLTLAQWRWRRLEQVGGETHGDLER